MVQKPGLAPENFAPDAGVIMLSDNAMKASAMVGLKYFTQLSLHLPCIQLKAITLYGSSTETTHVDLKS